MDSSRDQYISYNLYLNKRRANSFYNLAVKNIQKLSSTTTDGEKKTIYENIAFNLSMSHILNYTDVDTKKRMDLLCDGTYGYNNSGSGGYSDSDEMKKLIQSKKEAAMKECKKC